MTIIHKLRTGRTQRRHQTKDGTAMMNYP